VVTAAELLSIAAFEEGRYAQAFPTFGSERTGAPVVAFCRIFCSRPAAARAAPGALAGGWRHIASVFYEKRGTVFAEDERVVTAYLRGAQPMCSIPSGRPTHGCMRSSHTETRDAGKFGSTNAPTGTAMPSGPDQ
jgi:Pyruvate ferredoxin/flavodoxin oxidoreductase